MLGYRRRQFSQAYSLLHSLRRNQDDLAALRNLQQLLLRELVRTENKVREIKGELRTLSNAADKSSTRRVNFLHHRLEATRQCAYIWRCFGDGIAYLYMDKYALKQTYFSTETLSVKQNSGFISGKTGLAREIALLEEALKHGVPALLTDLTNTVRHGDVCLMGGADPFLLEVKTSKTLDSRGKKQKHRLKMLHDFFETDEVENLRGFSNVRRRSHDLPEQTYVEQMNECISEARLKGYAACQPEQSVCYLALTSRESNLADFLASLNFTTPWIFSLNEFKSSRNWAPYQPFLLMIKQEESLWAFIRGEIYIVVVIDTNRLCEIASDLGFQAVFDEESTDYPLRINVPGTEGVGVSRQMLARIAMECVSPEWVVRALVGVARRAAAEVADGSP